MALALTTKTGFTLGSSQVYKFIREQAMFNVVLYQPEIPQNAGNIARLCAATGCTLHLIGPLGFSLQDRYLKRAGLDYWRLVSVHKYDSLPEFFERWDRGRCFFVTTAGSRYYTEFEYQPGDFIVFGRETAGLPQELIDANRDRCLRIPMLEKVRCLNLANSVAIVVYEGLRKQMFNNMR
jgi:tRNA (cytidine/uridine-2'-O-)-methyltransferase